MSSRHSHVKQLSLDFVENVILHLFVLAVSSVGAVGRASTDFLDPLLKLLVKLGTEARGLLLLDLKVALVLLNGVMDSLSGSVSCPVHVAFLELRGAEEVHPNF